MHLNSNSEIPETNWLGLKSGSETIAVISPVSIFWTTTAPLSIKLTVSKDLFARIIPCWSDSLTTSWALTSTVIWISLPGTAGVISIISVPGLQKIMFAKLENY